jgi:hypothetical protein
MPASSNAGAELFIGTSGYSYPDWKGIVYLRSVKRDVGGSTPELTFSPTTSTRAKSTLPSIGSLSPRSQRNGLMLSKILISSSRSKPISCLPMPPAQSQASGKHRRRSRV